MEKNKKILIIIILLILVLVPRFVGIDKFVTVDEAELVKFGGNFYYALGQKEFSETYGNYIPAVTTMWAGAIAMHLVYSEYRCCQGYFVDEKVFHEFLDTVNVDPLELLTAGRSLLIILVVISLVTLFFLIKNIFDPKVSVVIILLISFDPFYLGMSRIMAHEGVMSIMLMISIFSLLNYQYYKRSWGFIILSSFSAAIAMLTKSPGIIILPFLFFLLMIEVIKKWISNKKIDIETLWNNSLKIFLILLFFVIIVYIAFWPAMWEAPIETIGTVYGNATSYAFKGLGQEAIDLYNIERAPKLSFNISWIVDSLIWRTTPIIYIGLIAFFYQLVFKKKMSAIQKRTGLYFLLFASLYMIMFGIAKGRQAHRYILSVHLCFDIIAGIGLFGIVKEFINNKKLQWLMFGLILSIQIFGALRFYPYYLDYYNPIVANIKKDVQIPTVGYGTGMELAAEYLNSIDGAEDLLVFAWQSSGPFSYFFEGAVNKLAPDSLWFQYKVDAIEEADYLIVMYEEQVQSYMPDKLLEGVQNNIPEHIIRLHGVEVIRIYKVEDLNLEYFQIENN